MRFIIMCGGTYQHWDTPRQLIKVNGEEIVARTIRLLRENGIEDIAISSEDSRFSKFGVPVLSHKNSYIAKGPHDTTGYWCDAFYLTDEPTCYLFGDVVFSGVAIKKIIETETDDIEFFASAPPFADCYPKKYAEPFALKVVNTVHLHKAIETTKRYQLLNKFRRKPIMWELWQVIKDTPLNQIDYTNYTAINDYTCDIDHPNEAKLFEDILGDTSNVSYMIHTMPKRMWYVENFLIPSMLAQGIDKDAITVFNDKAALGNLRACMESFKHVGEDSKGTWHIQDDVVLARNFKEQTEKHNRGIVCAFKSYYDNDKEAGLVSVDDMWWSFPCIRIPNKIAKECSHWVLNYMIGNPVYREWWKKGQGDDKFFRQFVHDYYKKERVLNLGPNIVDHIDYLIGGTVTSSSRKVVYCRSKLWEDESIVEELQNQLEEYYGMDNNKSRQAYKHRLV